MNVLIALDSFKESMTALEACESVEAGFKSVSESFNTLLVPMADGGEGTVQSLVDASGGKIVHCAVADPLKRVVDSFYGMMGDGKTAVIEMAAASGLAMIQPSYRNPLITTTQGTGELILHALQNGAEKVILGIGGSATNDGGVGMLQSFGIKFIAKNGKEIGAGGECLGDIDYIDVSGMNELVKQTEFLVACDVDNPLTGKSGASHIFGPQKGATPAMIELLDRNLHHFASKIKQYVSADIDDIPGSGAAGGLGGGCIAFLNAALRHGVDIVLEQVQFDEKLKSIDIVITGEGRVDHQTIFGKTAMGVAKAAKKYNIPVIALVGCVGNGYESVYNIGIDCVFSVLKEVTSLENALINGKANLQDLSANIARMMLSIKGLA